MIEIENLVWVVLYDELHDDGRLDDVHDEDRRRAKHKQRDNRGQDCDRQSLFRHGLVPRDFKLGDGSGRDSSISGCEPDLTPAVDAGLE